MAEVQYRGYIFLSAVEYLRTAAGEQKAKQLLNSASPQVQRALESAKHASWCASADVGEIYRMIASLSNNDDDVGRKHLIECGKFTAREASNTFLRLFMKMLTPTLFAKKLPDIWARDCTGGKIVVEVFPDKIRNQLVDMGELEHIAPVAVGYVAFALEAMGKSISNVALHGWSLATPAPADCWFEVAWRT